MALPARVQLNHVLAELPYRVALKVEHEVPLLAPVV